MGLFNPRGPGAFSADSATHKPVRFLQLGCSADELGDVYVEFDATNRRCTLGQNFEDVIELVLWEECASVHAHFLFSALHIRWRERTALVRPTA